MDMRYIDLSDKAKGEVQRRAAKKIDWVADMKRIEGEAEIAKSLYTGKRLERFLEQLRRNYRSAQLNKHFAETGINLAHVGLKD